MGEPSDALRERFYDQELALTNITRQYSTLAAVNKEDKAQLRSLNERHLRDVAAVGEARVQLEQTELRAAALAVAAKDCELLTEEKSALEAALGAAQGDVAREKRTGHDYLKKIQGLRDRADTLETYKKSASEEVAAMRKELAATRRELKEQTERAKAEAHARSNAETELGNLRIQQAKTQKDLESVRANLPELERKVKDSRDEVVVVERQRRNAEVALAAAIAARTVAEEAAAAAEQRVATSSFEIQALAGQLVEEQSAKTGLSTQLSSASETMAALSHSEDKLEKVEKQLRAEVNKAKQAEEKAARKEAEAEAAGDRIAELEKETVARLAGWDSDKATWAAERANILSDAEGRYAGVVREGARRMEAVTGELTIEYENLSDEHVALEQEAKELRAAAHRADFDKLRAETVLEEVLGNMRQELPGLDLQLALRERAEAVGAAERMKSELDGLRVQAGLRVKAEEATAAMEKKLGDAKSDLRHAEERLVAAVKARKELQAKLEEIGSA